MYTTLTTSYLFLLDNLTTASGSEFDFRMPFAITALSFRLVKHTKKRCISQNTQMDFITDTPIFIYLPGGTVVVSVICSQVHTGRAFERSRPWAGPAVAGSDLQCDVVR